MSTIDNRYFTGQLGGYCQQCYMGDPNFCSIHGNNTNALNAQCICGQIGARYYCPLHSPNAAHADYMASRENKNNQSTKKEEEGFIIEGECEDITNKQDLLKLEGE
jgi:hypothetical protein